MARIVKRTRTEPTQYVFGDNEVWLCKCGLSRRQPLCDGSHKLTKGEEPQKVSHSLVDFLERYLAKDETTYVYFDEPSIRNRVA